MILGESEERNVKKGINIWSFPAGMTIEECMKLAAKVGYDSIELSLDAEGPLSLKSSDEEIVAFRTLAADLGIEISSLASGMYWDTPLTSDDPAVREEAMRRVRFQLRAAKLLGCDAILVVAGCVGADFIDNCPVVPYDVAYDRAVEAAKVLAKDAEALGVTIAMENVWNKFLLSPLETRRFIDEVGSDYVKVYFDTGNVVQTGYPEHWVKILGKRIARVHIKDFRTIVGNINGFVDLLGGDVDFPAVIRELRACGYDGYLTAEMNGFPCKTDAVIWRTYDALDCIVNS